MAASPSRAVSGPFESIRDSHGLVFLMVPLLLVTSCEKPSEKAKREYVLMLKAGASGEERCVDGEQLGYETPAERFEACVAMTGRIGSEKRTFG